LYDAKWSPGALIVHKRRPDFMAALSYAGATATQYTLILTSLHLWQIMVIRKLAIPASVVEALPAMLASRLPTPLQLKTLVVFVTMLFSSVRTRVFSPLDNSRPKASAEDKAFTRAKPWWQPPPLAFPIIWSTIAVLRAVSSTMVYRQTGTLLCTPIFALFLHLCTGDTWNCINNVEERLGTAALVVPLVLATAGYTLMQFYTVSKAAARVFFPSVAWLTVATCLVWAIWRLNNSPAGKYSLFPSVEEGPPSRWRLPFARGMHK
jgi:tryptophan-rich sensory protein